MAFAASAVAAQPPASPTPFANLTASSATRALADAPKVRIANKLLSAMVLLPDAHKGFYRGVRFDWAGMISSLTFRGQEYYGLWFDRIDPSVRDYAFQGDQVAVGPNTAAMGPADAFDPAQPIGWADAPPGGTFLKIGVGLLLKPVDGAPYSSFKTYEWVDHGVWTVAARRDRVVFTHTVSDTGSGYGYVYRKELRFKAGEPVLEIRHSLKNTGARPIATTTFNHNFLTLGGSPSRPGLAVGAAFALTPTRPLRDVTEQVGPKLIYKRALAPEEVFSTPFAVGEAAPYDIEVRAPSGAGFQVKSDRPLASLALWSMRNTVCLEPFITLKAEPGQTTDWTFTYSYAGPANPKG